MSVSGTISIKPVDKTVEKWMNRARAGVDLYRIYTAAPKRSPTEAALSMKETLQQKMARPETWDKWEKNRRAVGDAGWLYGVQTKGVARYPQGIEAGRKYYEQFYTQFKPHLEAGLAKVYAIPRVTIDDAVRRAETMIRHNYTFRFEKKG
ncbi:MAG: hypothetical protein QXT64_04940 [Desulfurococcaceae archaeon]